MQEPREPSAHKMLRLATSRWRALMLMAEAEHRTPEQQLAYLVDRWWTQDSEMKSWLEEAYRQWPEMRQPAWWRRKKEEPDG